MDTTQVKSVHRYARISPTKVRLVAQQIRQKKVGDALNILTFSNKKSSYLIKKVLNSAISNAENNNNMDIDDLKVSRIFVDNGPTMKRFKARAKGRGNKILKRSSHITIFLTT